jgi:hypothetical protein
MEYKSKLLIQSFLLQGYKQGNSHVRHAHIYAGSYSRIN